MSKDNSNIVSMVDRAAEIMEFIFESEKPLGVSYISEHLDLPKATVFRILTTLLKWDIVEKYKNTDDYILGKALIKYGAKAKSDIDIVEIASTAIKNLAKEIGENVNLGIQYKYSALTLYSEKGESSALVSKLIPISPLNCSSMGKIFLADFHDDELKDYFKSKKYEKRTVNSITNIEEFKIQQQEIIDNKIAYDNEEYEYGLSCMACPIINSKGEILAAISVSGPTSRLSYKGRDDIEKKLRETANIISKNANYL